MVDRLVDLLLANGVRAEPWLALNDVDIDPWDLRRAAEALLDPDEPATAEEIRDAARQHGAEPWGMAAVALLEAGYAELGAELLKDMLARGVEATDLLSVLRGVGPGRLSELMDELLPTVRAVIQATGYSWSSDFVGILTDMGHVEEAVALAREYFVENIGSRWLPNVVEKWLEAGGMAVAEEVLAVVPERDVPAERRMRIADRFAAEGCSPSRHPVARRGPPPRGGGRQGDRGGLVPGAERAP